MSAEAREEEKKRMSAQMADTLKRMAEEVNIGSPLYILVNMMVLLPIILMVIDLGGFAIAACVVDLTGFQKLVYWIALTASVYMSVRVTKAIAKSYVNEDDIPF